MSTPTPQSTLLEPCEGLPTGTFFHPCNPTGEPGRWGLYFRWDDGNQWWSLAIHPVDLGGVHFCPRCGLRLPMRRLDA